VRGRTSSTGNRFLASFHVYAKSIHRSRVDVREDTPCHCPAQLLYPGIIPLQAYQRKASLTLRDSEHRRYFSQLIGSFCGLFKTMSPCCWIAHGAADPCNSLVSPDGSAAEQHITAKSLYLDVTASIQLTTSQTYQIETLAAMTHVQ
jgi:hypothetical protein